MFLGRGHGEPFSARGPGLSIPRHPSTRERHARLRACVRVVPASRSWRLSSRAWPRRGRRERATTSRRRTCSTCCTRRRRRVPYVSPTRRHASSSCRGCDYPPMRAGRRAVPEARRRARRAADARASTTRRAATASRRARRPVALVDVATGRETPVRCRAAGAPTASTWAADGKRFAFRNTSRDAVELWIGDAATAQVAPPRQRAAQSDARQHAAVDARPEDAAREARPRRSRAAAGRRRSRRSGPSIQETIGEKGESSTYETRDTLTSKHDEDLFDYYATSQLALVDARPAPSRRWASRRSSPRSTSRPTASTSSSTSIHKPYSYVTTYGRFAHDVEVWDRAGQGHARSRKLPLADRVPIHGVPTGPRDFEWRPTEPATLVWAEALDGGDWKVKVPARDKVMMQSGAVHRRRRSRSCAPSSASRASTGASSAASALLHEYDDNRHWRRTFVARRRRSGDEAGRPLGPVERRALQGSGPAGLPRAAERAVGACAQDGDAIFLAGRGASPDGDRPFLDRLDLETRKSERLFRSDKTALESFLAFTGADGRRVPHVAPVADGSAERDAAHARRRCRRRSRGEAAIASTARAVTHIPDPTPAVRAIKKRLVKYKRKDGTRALVHALHAARLQGGHARPGDPLRVPARLRERVDRRAGHRLRADVHAPRATTSCCSSPATRSSTTPRSRSSATRRRRTTRTSSSSSTTRRPRSTRPSSSASSIATASASPATATARS